MKEAAAIDAARLARARDIAAAALVACDGAVWLLPIYERLEAEIEAARAREGVIARARAAAVSGRVGIKPRGRASAG